MDNVHILIMQNIDEYWICILLLMSFAYAYTLTHTWVYTVHGYHTHDTVRWWHCLTKAPESAQRDSLSRVFRPSNSQIPIPQNARSLHFQLHEYLNHLNPEGDSLSHVECAAAFHIIAQGAAPHRESVLPEWGWAICPLEQHLWCWLTVLKA